MKILRTASLVIAIVGSVAASVPVAAKADSGCAGGTAGECRYLVKATEELTGMLISSDPAPLRRHLAKDAIWVTPRGEVRTGTELIAAVAADKPRSTARLERAFVRFFGDTAIVTWSETWTAPGAAVTAGRLAGVDTWAKRAGRWRLIATAETRLAP